MNVSRNQLASDLIGWGKATPKPIKNNAGSYQILKLNKSSLNKEHSLTLGSEPNGENSVSKPSEEDSAINISIADSESTGPTSIHSCPSARNLSTVSNTDLLTAGDDLTKLLSE